MKIKTLCVYCGASAGASTDYADGARALAQALVQHEIGLVYGGGKIGLMGTIADEMIRLGGAVTGVIPASLLAKEIGHSGLTALHIVKDMHERKAMMAKLADGFIAMPGGIGTLEELFEMLTWSQLGFHDKPIGLLNVCGFYDGLLTFLDHLVRQGFLRAPHQNLLLHDADPLQLISRCVAFTPRRLEKHSATTGDAAPPR